jgi:hypothetical protein
MKRLSYETVGELEQAITDTNEGVLKLILIPASRVERRRIVACILISPIKLIE